MAYIAPNLVMGRGKGNGRGMALGLGAYNDDTPCGAIPAGDPYRSPGHWCMYAGQMLQFDDQGNVHPDPVPGGATVGPGSASSIIDKIPGGSTTLLVAAAAAGAYLMFGGKKRRR